MIWFFKGIFSIIMKKKSVFRRILKYLIFVVLVALVIYGLSLFFASRKTIEYIAPTAPVYVTKAERGSINRFATFSGYIESDATIPIVPLVNGIIREYNIKAGDYVEKDQVLAVIDKEAYRNQYLQAEAAYLGYENAYKRIVELEKLKAVTSQDLDTAKAQRDAAKAQMDLAELQLSYTDVKASASGTVLIATQTVGDIGNTQTPIAVIADLDSLVVNLNVSEKYYSLFNSLKDALKVIVTRPSDGLEVSATIVSIAPYIDPQTKTFAMKLSLDESLDFRPGMYIKATVVYETQDDILILPQSLRKADGSYYAVEDGKAKFAGAATEIEDENYFKISDEFDENTLFISSGQNTVLSGEPVSVLTED